MQTEADRSAQRCIVASFQNLYPNVKVVAEEVDKISQNLDVPKEWLITDLDPKILSLECPQNLRNITEDQVSLNNNCIMFVKIVKYKFYLFIFKTYSVIVSINIDSKINGITLNNSTE